MSFGTRGIFFSERDLLKQVNCLWEMRHRCEGFKIMSKMRYIVSVRNKKFLKQMSEYFIWLCSHDYGISWQLNTHFKLVKHTY